MKRIAILAALGLFLPTLLFAQSCEWVCTDDSVGGNKDYSGFLQLSEVLPNPEGDDTQYEFIELENISSSTAALSGWILEDASGRKFQIKEGEIKSGQFLALFRTTTKLSLNNTDGDEVRLFDPAGKLQDELQYEEKAEEEFSFARNGNTWTWTSKPTPNAKNEIVLSNDPPELETDIPEEIYANRETVFSAENSSDPDGDVLTITWMIGGETKIGSTVTHIFEESGEQNISVTILDGRGGSVSEDYAIEVLAYDLSDAIQINELYPKPAEGDDEFMELHNSGDKPVELSGWSITDGSKTFTFSSEHSIESGGYFVLYRTESKIALNDSGDSATLFKVDGTEVESVSYESSERGKSYSRVADFWNWQDPTPGADNQPDGGAVLGATTDDVFSGNQKTNATSAEFAQSFLEKYGVYLSGLFFGGAIGFSLFRKWKQERAENEEVDG